MADTIWGDMPDEAVCELEKDFGHVLYRLEQLPNNRSYPYGWKTRMRKMAAEFEQFWEPESEITLGALHKLACDWYKACEEVINLPNTWEEFYFLVSVDMLVDAVEHVMPMRCDEGCRGWGSWGYGCPECEEW